jgi:hypothetical protein
MAPLALTGVWANNQLSSTDQYVKTVAALAYDAAVAAAITDKVITEISGYVNVAATTSQALDAISSHGGLPAPPHFIRLSIIRESACVRSPCWRSWSPSEPSSPVLPSTRFGPARA